MIPGRTQVFEIEGERLSTGYHALSHHGNQPEKIAEYSRIGREHVKSFAKFVRTIESYRDAEDNSLLCSTAIVYGSGMGDSNTHDNTNLPTLVAGGGLNHGNHWAHDRNSANPRLLGDLYISVMQQLGMDVDQFAGANRNLNECFSA
jgi:hypothetical protein